MPLQLSVIKDDVTRVAADVLLLKYAQRYYGADEVVALRLVQQNVCSEDAISPLLGEVCLVATKRAIAPEHAMFVGVPRLGEFRYREMRHFARRAIETLAAEQPHVRSISATVHGAGYGLDIVESLRSLVLGFQQGLTTHPLRDLERITFVERNARRFEVINAALEDLEIVLPAAQPGAKPPAPKAVPEPERKKTVFVAMPFAEEFEDVYQFGIYAAVRKCGYVCEKVDESIFVGNIVERITSGIQCAEFIIADLTLEKPNVYLEVGFAWGLNKPVVLIARDGQRLHFDVSQHKCLFYKTIGKLNESLEMTIRQKFGPGSAEGEP